MYIVKERNNLLMKTLKLETLFGTYEVAVEVNSYQMGGGIYVGLICFEDGFEEPFADITVNVPNEFIPLTAEQFDWAPVDTNNCPWVEKFLTDNKLAEKTGRTVRSGWCEYPIYKFNREELSKYSK